MDCYGCAVTFSIQITHKISNLLIQLRVSIHTVWRKILIGESIDEFDEFLSICQHFPVKILR